MKSVTRNRLLSLTLLCATFFSTAAQAAIVDFEDVTPTSTIEPCFGAVVGDCSGPTLDSTGFRFSSPDNGFTNHAHLVSNPWISSSQSYPSNGTQYIGLDSSIIVMSPIDNVPFQIHSFDAAEGFLVDGNPLGFAAKLQVEGNISGGGIVSFIGDFDGLNDGAGVGIDFQTFVLPSTFTNLSSVTFRGLTTSGDPGAALFSVDNLAVAAVPIPSALLLFTSGLLSFVCSHRRRRSLTKCAA